MIGQLILAFRQWRRTWCAHRWTFLHNNHFGEPVYRCPKCDALHVVENEETPP